MSEVESRQASRWGLWWSRSEPIEEEEEVAPESDDSYGEDEVDNIGSDATWYQTIWNKVPGFPFRANNLMLIDENIRYSDLTEEQLQFLKDESMQVIMRNCGSWCWVENLSDIKIEDTDWIKRKGTVSVYGTGSVKYPLIFENFPVESEHVGYKIFIKNSLILPSDSPLDIFHTQPWTTKFANTIKEHYNFPNEKHLYLKNATDSLLREKKILIVSVTGHLPEKYEKFSLESQRHAQYLSFKLAQSLKHDSPSNINAISFTCPLDLEETTTCFEQCTTLLKNFEDLFVDIDAVFFVGVYHSVPLVIKLASHILQNHSALGFDEDVVAGILAFESNLEGYRFWDHSSDNNSMDTEQDYSKIQQSREKQLFQGSSRQQQDNLIKIRNYRKLDSLESLSVQQNFDWILNNWKLSRVTFFGKLYDNFMTVTQKLAIDYTHPKIFRHIWCSGKYMGIDTKKPEEIELPDIHLESLKFDSEIKIPENRLFEIIFLGNLLLAINLGHTDFAPLLKLISPFFISRSYNENTMSSNIKKQIQNELRPWLMEMELKWKTTEVPTDEQLNDLPESLSTLYSFLQFTHFNNLKNPNLVKIQDDVYDDDEVYKCFIENTIKTKSPINKKHLQMSNDHSTPKSILKTLNQYDLVWKFHEFLSDFMNLKNLPKQEYPPKVNFSISTDYGFRNNSFTDPNNFERNNKESLARISKIWDSYQHWSPPTRGLKQLKEILSVLLLYSDSQKLIKDIERK
ncbi:hypothetical protein Kpol_1043p15 [Vanderwaltozyma polyspora DSM 70294]|uniref:Uncharacterized protein n=1 Tax=Vanderwaltozyma polyspora (strain ATCC 22028 / DSM 70294 / BCRC 21397 / CBS 2163 / NBRC 10782 / NRRL Y-8283 / UCD 57-17) TaxID=436907 RepID=A7TIN3_VANPO|nr:uncharacterized protein Kpol_1043p15 [Vanderwaltozyma polyspora DSM 70294]EDO17825.1 hypothetical protein Kpol_1043p15 [Vanderwaltozyma polyspora DSM 70294]